MIEHRILGVISGSSLDGIDMAHCNFKFNRTSEGALQLTKWTLNACATYPFDPEWYSDLSDGTHASATDLLKLDQLFGKLIGSKASEFLSNRSLVADYIASHGHTIHHYPSDGFTCQIGHGASIVEASLTPAITGFRDQDIAAGGQGAPVAPIADAWLFDPAITFFLNLGGIANISCRSANGFFAFDITGCNQILNALAQTQGQPYDPNGKMAASGQLIPALLDEAMENPFLTLPYPKSLDNLWVKKNQTQLFLDFPGSTEDKLRTACQLIAEEIAKSIAQLVQKLALKSQSFRCLVTGGGAFNDFLMDCIQKQCHPIGVLLEKPEKDIIEFKEASLIALMGALRLERVPNVLASVTGAKRDTINGSIYTM